jgi:glycerophosphoryl diester phosphodiesterase
MPHLPLVATHSWPIRTPSPLVSALAFSAVLAACAGTTSPTSQTSTTPVATQRTLPANSVTVISPVTTAFVNTGNPFRIGRTLVIPHGGGDGLFPENTLYAYEHSMAMGADVVDIDVSLSADNQLVAFHDASLERTTNGVGEVATKTYQELAKLDAGWGFTHDGGHPFRGKGLEIPTVEAILTRFPKTLVTIDLKDLRLQAVEPLCSLLTRLGRTEDVYIGVDTREQVDLFRSTCAAVHTSGTDLERQAMRAARDAGNTALVTHQRVSQPSFMATDGTRRVTAKTVAFSHALGIAVLPWVVDDPKDMAELLDLGIDGIYTRRPDVLLKLIGDRKKSDPLTR